MINAISRKNVLIAAFCAAVSLPAIGIAGEIAEVNSTMVGYSDLNISTVEGRDTLERRLRQAAKQVCGSQSITIVGLARAADNRRCADNSFARAQAQVSMGSSVALTSR